MHPLKRDLNRATHDSKRSKGEKSRLQNESFERNHKIGGHAILWESRYALHAPHPRVASIIREEGVCVLSPLTSSVA